MSLSSAELAGPRLPIVLRMDTRAIARATAVPLASFTSTPWPAPTVLMSACSASLPGLDVLLIDDWDLAPVQDPERRDLLEILADRYGTRSTIITSQLRPLSGTTTSPTPPWPMRSAIGSSTTPIDSC